MHFAADTISRLDKDFRRQLINSVSGFKSPYLVGTKDLLGNEYLATVTSVFHLGSHPPLLGIAFRPNSAPKSTMQNILEMGFYTLNLVSTQMITQAHQTSKRYDKDESEFKHSGLSAEYLNNFPAPYVVQSQLKLGIRAVEKQQLAVNDSLLLVGLIVDIHVVDQAIQGDGFIDHECLNTAAISGLDSYHSTNKVKRLKFNNSQSDTNLLEGNS